MQQSDARELVIIPQSQLQFTNGSFSISKLSTGNSGNFSFP